MANYILKKDGHLYNKKTGHKMTKTKRKAPVRIGKEVILSSIDYYRPFVNGKMRWIQCDRIYDYNLSEYNIEVEV